MSWHYWTILVGRGPGLRKSHWGFKTWVDAQFTKTERLFMNEPWKLNNQLWNSWTQLVINAERKWPPFCRRNFQLIFRQWKWKLLFLIQISLKFVRRGTVHDKSELVQVMATRILGNKRLSEPTMTYVNDAYMRHSPQCVDLVDLTYLLAQLRRIQWLTTCGADKCSYRILNNHIGVVICYGYPFIVCRNLTHSHEKSIAPEWIIFRSTICYMNTQSEKWRCSESNQFIISPLRTSWNTQQKAMKRQLKSKYIFFITAFVVRQINSGVWLNCKLSMCDILLTVEHRQESNRINFPSTPFPDINTMTLQELWPSCYKIPEPLLLTWVHLYPTWISNQKLNKCGMKLFIHSQTSTVAPWKFGNG